jgi:hypothetical protein
MTSVPALRPEDVEHLRLLAIFHYVVAGMQALFASFPVIHLAMGLTMVFAPQAFGMKDPQEGWIGWFFVLFAGTWMLIGWTLAACTVLAGRALSRRRRYMFCFVVAAVMAVTCMPFGTVLGVFTIIVLLRPQVKAAFGRPA